MKRPHLPMVELPHLRCPGCGAHLQPVKSRHIPLAEKYEDCLRRCERCRIGAITPEERAAVRSRSPVGAKYDTPVNRESAHEILNRRTADKASEGPDAKPAGTKTKPAEPDKSTEGRGKLGELLWGTKRRQGMVETMAKQTVRTIGSQLGRQILRGVLGGILGRR